MRILFWSQDFLPTLGGVEIYTRNIAKALLRSGHEVCVIAGACDSGEFTEDETDGIQVFRLPFFPALNGRDLRLIKSVQDRIVALRKEFQPDIAHINVTDPSPFFYLRTRPKTEPYIAVFHYPLGKLTSGMHLIKQLSEGANTRIALSDFMATHLAQKLNCSLDRFETIRNGADENIFHYHKSGITRTNTHFIFAGRLIEEKGIWVLLDAFARLKESGVEIKLDIVGTGPDEAALGTEVNKLGLKDRIRFRGRLSQEQLASAFRNAYALVLPSTFEEPAPLVVVEAAMAGLPIVASRLGGIPEMVEDGVSGLLCEPGNPTDLFEKIRRLVTSADLHTTLSENARARAASVPTTQEMARKYISIYENIFQGKSSRLHSKIRVF